MASVLHVSVLSVIMSALVVMSANASSLATTLSAYASSPGKAEDSTANVCMVDFIKGAGVLNDRAARYAQLLAAQKIKPAEIGHLNSLALRLSGVRDRTDRLKIARCFSILSGENESDLRTEDGISYVCSHRHACNSHGACHLQTSQTQQPVYGCTCEDGYHGEECQYDSCMVYGTDNQLIGKRCQNGGNCSRSSGYLGFACDCPRGYRGDDCQEMIDVCESNPCSNDGRCRSDVSGYQCECAIGYTGVRCEEKWLVKGVISSLSDCVVTLKEMLLEIRNKMRSGTTETLAPSAITSPAPARTTEPPTTTPPPRRFTLFNEQKSWHDAKTSCVSKGGVLAHIISAEENVHVTELAANTDAVWLGGGDADLEGVWKWLDGRVFWRHGVSLGRASGRHGISYGYENWRTAPVLEPNNTGPNHNNENCLALELSVWNDQACSVTLPYICRF